jgi:hypothetical protein
MADAPSSTPIGGSMQDLVSVQGNGVRYLGLLIQQFKNSFPGQFVPAPANSTASGTPNQVAFDATHFYVCISPNTWVRATLATF